MHFFRVLSAIWISSLALATTRPALAEPSDPDDAASPTDPGSSVEAAASDLSVASPGSLPSEGSAASRAAYNKGVALTLEKRFIEAQREFEQAVRERPPLDAYFGLGQVELALGHPCAAVEAYSKYLEIGGSRVSQSKRRSVQTHIDQLRQAGASQQECSPKEPQSTLYLECAGDGISALVDGSSQAVGNGEPIVLSAGEHEVQFVGGDLNWPLSQVDVEAGGSLHLSCVRSEPKPSSTVLDAGTPISPTEEDGLTTRQKIGVGVTAGGIGVAMAALGHFLWNRGRYEGYNAEGSRLEENGGSTSEWNDYEELGNSIQRAGKMSLGLAIAGGVLTGVGVTLILLDTGKKSTTMDAEQAGTGDQFIAHFSGDAGEIRWRTSW